MSVLQGGRTRRRTAAARDRPADGQRRRSGHARHVVALAIGVVVLTAGALLGLMAARATGPATIAFPGATPATAKHPAAPPKPVRGDYGIALAPPAQRIHVMLKLPLKSGVLFDVNTGRVLWERNPCRIGADREPHEDDDRARRGGACQAERPGPDHPGRARLHGLGRRAPPEGQARAAGGPALRAAPPLGKRRRDRPG